MTLTESCLKTKSLTRPVMISNSSVTRTFLSSLGTCDFRRKRSQSFLERAIESALGLAALRSCFSTFCFACASLDVFPALELATLSQS